MCTSKICDPNPNPNPYTISKKLCPDTTWPPDRTTAPWNCGTCASWSASKRWPAKRPSTAWASITAARSWPPPVTRCACWMCESGGIWWPSQRAPRPCMAWRYPTTRRSVMRVCVRVCVCVCVWCAMCDASVCVYDCDVWCECVFVCLCKVRVRMCVWMVEWVSQSLVGLFSCLSVHCCDTIYHVCPMCVQVLGTGSLDRYLRFYSPASA